LIRLALLPLLLSTASAKEPTFAKKQAGHFLEFLSLDLQLKVETDDGPSTGTIRGMETCEGDWAFALGKDGSIQEAEVTYGNCEMGTLFAIGGVPLQEDQQPAQRNGLNARVGPGGANEFAMLFASHETEGQDAITVYEDAVHAHASLALPKQKSVDATELAAYTEQLKADVWSELSTFSKDDVELDVRNLTLGKYEYVLVTAVVTGVSSEDLGFPGTMVGTFTALGLPAARATVGQRMHMHLLPSTFDTKGMKIQGGYGVFEAYQGNAAHQALISQHSNEWEARMKGENTVWQVHTAGAPE